MLPIQDWLSDRNLHKLSPEDGVRWLEGEALTYALVTYLVHPEQLPEAAVIALAEDYFARLQPAISE